MSILRPPEILRLTELDEKGFDVWLAAFADYRRFSKHFSEEEAKKDPSLEVSLFLTIAGIEVRTLVSGLTHDDTFGGIIAAIRKYLRPFSNVVVERNKFFTLKQESDEEIQHFLVRLKQQVIKCDFSDDSVDTIDNQMIRDQFIKGLAHPKIRESLLKEEGLTLKKTELIAASINAAELTNKDFDRKNDRLLLTCSKQEVHKKLRPRSSSRKRTAVTCFTCKKPGHVAKDCYKNHTCKKCHKVGHTEKFCRVRRNENAEHTSLSLGPTDSHPQLCFIDSELNGHSVKLLVDTGSTVSLISRKFVTNNNLLNVLEPCDFSCMMADASKIFFNEVLCGKVNFKGIESQSVISVHLLALLNPLKTFMLPKI